jgi:adenine-specific DNA-methyltransferase
LETNNQSLQETQRDSQRRLLIARNLLKPDDSALVVAIDEKEYLRLGLLLAQTFPEADIQMVTAVTNRAGSPRSGRFSRVEEYLFFVFFGSSTVVRSGTTMLVDQPSSPRMPNVWFSAIRVGTGSALREARPGLFYPVHLDAKSGRLHSVGEPLARDFDRVVHTPPEGTVVMWPLASDGREQTWRFSNTRMREYFENGWARLGRRDASSGSRPVTYLRPETRKNIEDGIFTVAGRTEEGAVILELAEGASKLTAPAAVWNVSSHYARDYGSRLNVALIPNRAFPYPKSLYAVEDALRFVIGEKPSALVLDFFAGSGTTAHAIVRLNRQDGGRRQAIVVTNNEVSVDEAKSLAERGHHDGDPEWEALGIFEHITRPRVTAAVTGLTPDGTPIKGDYKFIDEFPMAEGFEENVEFMKLTYLDPVDVELDRAFTAVAPMLWLRAGGQGSMVSARIDASGELLPFAVAERYGVLFDPDRWRDFVAALPEDARTVFVVTDSAAVFAGVAESFPSDLAVVRLYENYLTTFAINQGRAK